MGYQQGDRTYSALCTSLPYVITCDLSLETGLHLGAVRPGRGAADIVSFVRHACCIVRWDATRNMADESFAPIYVLGRPDVFP